MDWGPAGRSMLIQSTVVGWEGGGRGGGKGDLLVVTIADIITYFPMLNKDRYVKEVSAWCERKHESSERGTHFASLYSPRLLLT